MAMEISTCAAHMVTAEVPGRDITTPRRWGMSLGGALTLRISQVWRNKYLAIKVGVQKRKQDKLEAIAKLHMGADALEDRMRKEAGLGGAAADPFRHAAAPAASISVAGSYSNVPSSSDEAGPPIFLGTRHSFATPSSRSSHHSESTERALQDVLLDRAGLKKDKKPRFYHETNLLQVLVKMWQVLHLIWILLSLT
jgi:hypothetical protein